MTYLVNNVGNTVLDDRIAGKDPGSTNEDIGALNCNCYSSAGEGLVGVTMLQVRGEYGQADDDMPPQDFGKDAVRQPWRDDGAIWSEEGNAGASIKVFDKACPLQNSKSLVGADEGQRHGQKTREGKQARDRADDALVVRDIESRDLDDIAETGVDDGQGAFRHVLLDDA